ncbi:FAD-dependent oxidoreductase [Nocardia wallacei]|uniref:FAD-dependent oxidoreductase n=1 Tax=Nocardia wallacei TaxID=480035 RepID=UPI0024559204|nr:FAD-dependent oxidoreductase [Nocardia wallacei]
MTDPQDQRRQGDTRGRRVVVSGAGIAGLATALRLYRSGWEVLVVERAPGRRSGGYLVNLLGYGYDAAERMGVLPALAARDIGWFTSIIVGADGRDRITIPAEVARAALAQRALSLFRGDIETVLFEAVHAAVDLRFGTTVRAVDQHSGGVEITLSDGTRERADLLVGADGLHSGIREIAFGPKADHLVDLRHMVGAFPLSRVPEEVPDASSKTFIGLGRTAAVINVGPRRSSAFFTYRADDPAAELARGATAALSARFGDLGGSVPDALRQLENEPGAAYFDSVSQIVMDRWSSGRVVLLGDAAWCVTPFAGYGAALALAGAGRLGDALDEHDDIPAALAEWETMLRPDIRKRQALARRGASQFAPPTRAHLWMNNLMLRAMRLPVTRKMLQRSVERANA